MKTYGHFSLFTLILPMVLIGAFLVWDGITNDKTPILVMGAVGAPLIIAMFVHRAYRVIKISEHELVITYKFLKREDSYFLSDIKAFMIEKEGSGRRSNHVLTITKKDGADEQHVLSLNFIERRSFEKELRERVGA